MMTQYTGNQTGQIPGILPDLGQIPNGMLARTIKTLFQRLTMIIQDTFGGKVAKCLEL